MTVKELIEQLFKLDMTRRIGTMSHTTEGTLFQTPIIEANYIEDEKIKFDIDNPCEVVYCIFGNLNQ